jgi:hypothetical protein
MMPEAPTAPALFWIWRKILPWFRKIARSTLGSRRDNSNGGAGKASPKENTLGADLILCHHSRLEEMQDRNPTERFAALIPTLPMSNHLYDPYGHSNLNRLGLSWLSDIRPITGIVHRYEDSGGGYMFIRGISLPTCESLLSFLRNAEVRTGEIPISAETRERVGVIISNDTDPERVQPPPLPYRSLSERDRTAVEGWRAEAVAFFELAIATREMPLCSL